MSQTNPRPGKDGDAHLTKPKLVDYKPSTLWKYFRDKRVLGQVSGEVEGTVY
jgi:hypothetical protein